jgi:hypothetical protein
MTTDPDLLREINRLTTNLVGLNTMFDTFNWVDNDVKYRHGIELHERLRLAVKDVAALRTVDYTISRSEC